jgi:hypothetical protein
MKRNVFALSRYCCDFCEESIPLTTKLGQHLDQVINDR